MIYSTDTLRSVMKRLPTVPQEIAPDQYEVYVPSFQEEVKRHVARSSASNAATRHVGKGLFSIKGLLPQEQATSGYADEDIQNLITDALAMRED